MQSPLDVSRGTPQAKPRRPISGHLGTNRGSPSPGEPSPPPGGVFSTPKPERRVRNEPGSRVKPANAVQVRRHTHRWRTRTVHIPYKLAGSALAFCVPRTPE